MNRILALLLIALPLFGQAPPRVESYFSPGDNPTAAITKTLGEAKKSILVQAYYFTSAPIADALRQAHRRGVDVQVILDKSQPKQRYTVATFLTNAGIPVYIDSSHAIMHNKIMIVDGQTVITGSFNFTKAAEEKNAENLVIIHSEEQALRYTANWNRCRAHSVPHVQPD